MTSLYAVTYMYSINSSYDSFVPVKDATARNHADLFINLRFTLNDWNRLFSINIIFISFQEDTTVTLTGPPFLNVPNSVKFL